MSYQLIQGQSIKDSLFVWSSNGLNLREKPDPKSTKIKALKAGECVKYLSISDKTFTEVLIDSNELVMNPFLLKSHWIKVISGIDSGYVLDSYVLPTNPNLSYSSFDSLMIYRNNNTIHIDTIYRQVEEVIFGWDFNLFLKDSTQVINHTETGGSTQTYIVPNMTLNEAIIMIKFYQDKHFLLNKYSIQYPYKLGLIKNWKNELIFKINETCKISLIQNGKYLKIESICAC